MGNTSVVCVCVLTLSIGYFKDVCKCRQQVKDGYDTEELHLTYIVSTKQAFLRTLPLLCQFFSLLKLSSPFLPSFLLLVSSSLG